MSNNSIACHNDSSGQYSILPVCIYSFISTVGLIFNITALAFFFHNTKSRSHTIVYMTNLAIADTLLVLTLPMRIYYHLGFPGLPQWLCDGLGLVLKANMYGSIFLLTSICFDRCMAVSFPMSSHVQEGRRKAPVVCLGIWILTFGASLPIYLFGPRTDSHYCFNNLPIYAIQLKVVLPTLLMGFGFPLVIMLICSWGLVRSVQKSTVAQTKLVDSRKIYRMIATSLLIFLISFLPYHATLVLLSLDRYKNSCTVLTAYRYSLMVACLNTVLDPIAYYFTTDTFRRSVDTSTVRRMFPMNSQSSESNGKSRRPRNS
ncbi:lysophosphatidic acid receptor 6 [Pleuronectes platessa]|uniref:lysophosphatidic acid receptor 6 n=1 Tax=Pleuronectes platessa TaxID=8262 RepID=UPI00232A7500|nr:lysophosphatidic acid receptor 6 [Pleuronectes platessa]